MPLEEAAAKALGKLALQLWDTFHKELKRASSAREERQCLVDWIKVIEEDVLKHASLVQATDGKHKVGIEKLREFVDDARRLINKYDQSARVNRSHDLLRDNNLTREVEAALGKLERGLKSLKKAADTANDYARDYVQRSPATDLSSSIAYSEERYKLLVGIEERQRELLSWLREDDLKAKMIFVHGAPGLGKTSLVGAVLRNQEMRERFNFYVWIEDLRSCELADSIAEALWEVNAIIWELTDDGNERQAQMKLQEVFQLVQRNAKSRLLLVLDDASKAEVFSSLAVPLFQTRSSVLVTTRISGLASPSEFHLARLGPQESERWFHFVNFKLPNLSMRDSRDLFWQIMPVKYRSAGESTVDIDSILKKCGGSPLAIEAMCEHLIHEWGSDDDAQLGEWNASSGSLLSSSLSEYEKKGSITRMMTQCRDQHHNVQDWILYLSIFPLDCPLRYSTLMRLWMAEGFQDLTLKKLVEHNFFHEIKRTSYGKLGTCRLSNLLHQIIISKSMEDEFAMIVAAQKEGKTPRDTIRRMSIHSTPKIEVTGVSVHPLVSLHVSEEVGLQYMSKLLGYVKKGKVLNLQRYPKIEKNRFQYSSRFPGNIFYLKYLTYLSLRDTKVDKIPDEIGDLQNLMTLDLKGTNVLELPKEVFKLQRLLHLLVYRSDKTLAAGTAPKRGIKAPPKVVVTDPKHGVQASSELGDLKLLQTLCMIDLDPIKQLLQGNEEKKRERLVNAIGKLTNLRRLGISRMKSTDVRALFSSIEKLTNLEALRIIAAPGQSIDLSDRNVSSVPENLKRVHLTGWLGTSSNQILSHIRVVKLVLKDSRLEGDPLPYLQKLCHLKHLELQQAFDVTELRFQAERLKSLCFLGLDKIDRLEYIVVDEEALPALQTLSLARCTSFKAVLPDVTRPKSLKCLKLKGMSEEFKREVKENKNIRDRGIMVEWKEWKEAVEEVTEAPANRANSSSCLRIRK